MIVTFILAFCSIVYEFLLSQILAALLGGTFIRYTTTIALYIFALGLGAFYLEKIKHRDSFQSLFKLEILLSSMGAFIPVIAILGEGFLPQPVVVAFCYGLVLLIGFLSGIELPLLMQIEESKRSRGGLLALGVDFLGTFAGCILFPLVFLTQLGLFRTASVVATLNLVVALYLLPRLESRKSAMLFGAMAILICGLSYSADLNTWVVEKVYLR